MSSGFCQLLGRHTKPCCHLSGAIAAAKWLLLERVEREVVSSTRKLSKFRPSVRTRETQLRFFTQDIELLAQERRGSLDCVDSGKECSVQSSCSAPPLDTRSRWTAVAFVALSSAGFW